MKKKLKQKVLYSIFQSTKKKKTTTFVHSVQMSLQSGVQHIEIKTKVTWPNKAGFILIMISFNIQFYLVFLHIFCIVKEILALKFTPISSYLILLTITTINNPDVDNVIPFHVRSFCPPYLLTSGAEKNGKHILHQVDILSQLKLPDLSCNEKTM